MRDASSRATKAFSGDVHVRSDFLRRFERRPRLTVAIVEFELAWVYLSRAPRRGDLPVQGSDTPERFLPPQRRTGFQEDAIGIRLRDVIGLDNMMWGSDCATLLDHHHRDVGPAAGPLPNRPANQPNYYNAEILARVEA